MKSEERKGRSALRVALVTGALGLGMVFSLGIVGRHAESSKQTWVIAPAASNGATAQADSDPVERHYAGHSELELQPD